ncbi:class B sortase [Oscillospiraceae bacterium MB08-C2-2]|nr:class B sortase [Oscillospiraceae bacterium MB08-C2-2]
MSNPSRRRASSAKKAVRRTAVFATTGFVVILSGVLCLHSLFSTGEAAAAPSLINGSVTVGSVQTKTHMVSNLAPSAAEATRENKPKVETAVYNPSSAKQTDTGSALKIAPVSFEDDDDDQKEAVAASVPVKKFGDKISEWNKINGDVKAWLQVGGTNIDYPVIFYPQDVNYYTHLNYRKQQDKNGVIWADAKAVAGSAENLTKNTVIYGHNWTNYSTPKIGDANDVMFAQLPAFHYLDFAKQNQFINFSTAEGDMRFQVFAAFYTEIDFYYNNSAPTTDELKAIISSARNRSLHDYDIQVSGDDKIVTLSTCTRVFGKTDRQRFVVMGKLVDSTAQNVTVTANNDYQKPNL